MNDGLSEEKKGLSQDEMARERTELSELRTGMATERTDLAYERTALTNSHVIHFLRVRHRIEIEATRRKQVTEMLEREFRETADEIAANEKSAAEAAMQEKETSAKE